MKKLKLKLLAGLIGLSSLGLAHADTATTDAQVTTTVTALCTINATPLSFPSFSQTATAAYVQATTTITPVCSKGTSYTIYFDEGGEWYDKRYMKNDVDSLQRLGYDLYQPDGVSLIAPNWDKFTNTGDGIGGADQSFVVTGKIDTSQNVASGSYKDTVLVYVQY